MSLFTFYLFRSATVIRWSLCTMVSLFGVQMLSAQPSAESTGLSSPYDDASIGSRSARNMKNFRLGAALGTGYQMRETKNNSGLYRRPMLTANIYARHPIGRHFLFGADIIASHRADALPRIDQSDPSQAKFAQFHSLEGSLSLAYLFYTRICDAYITGGAQATLLYNQQTARDYFGFDQVKSEFFSAYKEVRIVRPFIGTRLSKEFADYVYFDLDFQVIGPGEYIHVDGQKENGVIFALRGGVSWEF